MNWASPLGRSIPLPWFCSLPERWFRSFPLLSWAGGPEEHLSPKALPLRPLAGPLIIHVLSHLQSVKIPQWQLLLASVELFIPISLNLPFLVVLSNFITNVGAHIHRLI